MAPQFYPTVENLLILVVMVLMNPFLYIKLKRLHVLCAFVFVCGCQLKYLYLTSASPLAFGASPVPHGGYEVEYMCFFLPLCYFSRYHAGT